MLLYEYVDAAFLSLEENYVIHVFFFIPRLFLNPTVVVVFGTDSINRKNGHHE